MESRGGSYTQQSNDEGVCGGNIFFARKFNYNDDVDDRMTTTTMMGIHGVGNGGYC